MARYILIDDYSGYIWGDTGDLDGLARQESPAEAAQRLDDHIGGETRVYIEHGPHYRLDGASGYHVYRADIDGSEVVPLVVDGQNRDTIEAVLATCQKIAVVEYRSV